MIRLVIAELNTPTGQIGPLSQAYGRAMGAIGHAALGACFMGALGLWGLLPGLAMMVAYWIAKERRDLRHGGALWDGIEDTAMVGLGAFYGAVWWPFALIGFAGLVMLSAAGRAK